MFDVVGETVLWRAKQCHRENRITKATVSVEVLLQWVDGGNPGDGGYTRAN